MDLWVKQFDEDVQEQMLFQMNHVLDNTCISRPTTKKFQRDLVTLPKLTGDDPTAFWKRVTPLRIQKDGMSQSELLLDLDGGPGTRVRVALNGSRGRRDRPAEA